MLHHTILFYRDAVLSLLPVVVVAMLLQLLLLELNLLQHLQGLVTRLPELGLVTFHLQGQLTEIRPVLLTTHRH
jgi:hypothetical protein